ncbi:MAG: ATP-grasp domain-containing protein [Candidatus Thermoplasmatota archaeon]|nr:ATP-grasp domain-containing protein [Candidatus Thermoplasmatota archaeon]
MKIALLYSHGNMASAFPHDFKGREENTLARDVKCGLLSLGHSVSLVPANDEMVTCLAKMREEIDLVFNLADDGYNLDTQLEPQIPAVLDIMGIKYTGSNHLCLGTCLDKARTKQILVANGIPTPRFVVFDGAQGDDDVLDLKYPLIVKPSREDGSIGIRGDSVVENRKELEKKAHEVMTQYGQPALVEEFIGGREANVGIIGRNNLEVLPISEIVFNLQPGERNIVSYHGKWEENSSNYVGTKPRCPAELDPTLEEALKSMALSAYKIMGLRDYGRIDFRIDQTGRPHILEVNPNPDISRDAGLSRMATARGMTYEKLIEKIISFSIEEELEGEGS